MANRGVLDTFNLAGKTALVTGGYRGIGNAIAWALAEAGASLIIAARNLDKAEQAAEAFKEAGHSASALKVDVADYESVQQAIARIEGNIDVLVNNAGICYHEAAVDIAPERFTEVINVNLNGVWFCSQAVGKRMIAQGGGTIINIGSMSGDIVNRPQMQPAYNASKAAVHHLTRSLAAEWAPHHIRVNAIAPGYINTDMAPVDDPRFKRYWVDDVPQRRAGLPSELGPLAVLLASEASSFMTGEIVTADGGYTLF